MGDNENYLAGLAGMDTDDIKALSTKLFPESLVDIIGSDVKIGSIIKDDELKGIRVSFSGEVLAAEPIDTDLDPDDLIDRRVYTDSVIWIRNGKPDKEDIGVIKGLFAKVGLETDGVFFTEDDTGWLYNFIGAKMRWQVSHKKSEAGEFSRIKWLPSLEE